MFCHKCGTANAETATACTSCNTPLATARAGANFDAMKAESTAVLVASKALLTNPVGALPSAFTDLGEARAKSRGIAFGVISLVCFFLAGPILLSMPMGQLYDFLGFGGIMKLILFAAIPFVGLVAGSLAVRKLMGGQGSTGGDFYIAGAALLPISISMLIGSLLGMRNYQIALALGVVAGCLAILMLFTGYTRISRLTERAGSYAVPLVVLLVMWIARVALDSVMPGVGGGGNPYAGFGNY